jgi:hypothetical protein
MNRLDTVGLIINPKAGQGYEVNARTALAVLQSLHPANIFTGPGELGENALRSIDFATISVVTIPAEPGRAQTQALALKLAEIPLSALIIIGGDGTLADVACVLIGQNSAIPLMGIGVGSTNAGNLITCCAAELDRLNPDRLQVSPIKALLAYDSGQLLGIGFNDCVLGFTVVGTIDGAVCDVDAEAKMSGQNRPGIPRSIGTNRTIVQRINSDGIQKVAIGRRISTVVIGFAEQAFFAKAITGGVCLTTLVKAPAGCLVADIPLVQIGLERREVLALPSIHSSYIALDEYQRIRVSGTRKGTALCVDGNPLKLLHPADIIEFSVEADAVQSIRLVKI